MVSHPSGGGPCANWPWKFRWGKLFTRFWSHPQVFFSNCLALQRSNITTLTNQHNVNNVTGNALQSSKHFNWILAREIGGKRGSEEYRDREEVQGQVWGYSLDQCSALTVPNQYSSPTASDQSMFVINKMFCSAQINVDFSPPIALTFKDKICTD